MESVRKIAALILLLALFSSAHALQIGGAVSYTMLLGEFGRDLSGATTVSLLCGTELSGTENVSIMVGYRRHRGRENEILALTVSSASLRLMVFPLEKRPYFLSYAISFNHYDRSMDGQAERGSHPVVGFGFGVSVVRTSHLHVAFGAAVSRILERYHSANSLAFDAELVYHL